MKTCDVMVIGGGIIGAAVLRELSRWQIKAVLLEAKEDLARGASGANSGIVHAGYDPRPGSAMAYYNVKGCAMYPALCEKLNIPYRPVGSLVIAFTEEQMQEVKRLYARGLENGVPQMELIDATTLKRMEPQIAAAAIGALYAPTAGIVSPYEATIALAENAVENGASVCLNTPVNKIEKQEDRFIVTAGCETWQTNVLINCAGAAAGDISEMAGGEAMPTKLKKGEYTLYDRNMGGFVKHVIFQTPDENGKGVLVTPTAEGNLLLGPSSEAVESAEETASTQAGQQAIWKQGRKSCPALPENGAITSFAGVRAVAGDDFIIRESTQVAGLIQVAGICSPGLTSAPAIAEDVARMALDRLGTVKRKEGWKETRQAVPCVRELSFAERAALCAEDADFGKIVCRCETVTEGQIRRVLRSAVPVYTVEGVKRRCRAGMGRCQGSFCTPRVMQLIAEEAGLQLEDVCKAGPGTEIARGRLKEVHGCGSRWIR